MSSHQRQEPFDQPVSRARPWFIFVAGRDEGYGNLSFSFSFSFFFFFFFWALFFFLLTYLFIPRHFPGDKKIELMLRIRRYNHIPSARSYDSEGEMDGGIFLGWGLVYVHV